MFYAIMDNAFFLKCKRAIDEALAAIEAIEHMPAKGALYVYPRIRMDYLHIENDEQFILKLLEKVKVWALYVTAKPFSFEGSLWISGGITLSGLLLLQFGDNLPLFFAGMLLREFGLNALSARFLANVTNTNPMAVAPWLALFMFGGSAFGPVLRGISIDYQTPLIFSMFSFGVCLLPAVYVWWLRSRTAPM